MKSVLNTANITGFKFSRLTLQATIDLIEKWAVTGNSGVCRYFACVNPHSLEVARRDAEFAEAIHEADLVTPDGTGVVLASRILKAGIPERACGPDIFPMLSKQLNEKNTGTKMFFLGSTPENLAVLEKRYQEEFQNLKVVGTYSPPYKPAFSDKDFTEMIERVNQSGADILWLGLGAPKQEKWARACRDRLKVKVIGPIGGVFDFYTGRVKLPPMWAQKMGLIFLIRLFQEPKRLWRRNVDSPVFLARVFCQRFCIKRSGG